MYACLTTLLSWEKKGVYGPRKIVMEMSNIMVLHRRPSLVKNIPLFALLFKQCGTNEKRQDALEQLILDYIADQNEGGAMEVFPLVWPNILEGILIEGSEDGRRYFPVKEGKDAFVLYNLDLSKSGAVDLDRVLIKYTERLDYLILTTFCRLKNGATVPETFIEYAALEMVRASHIMSDPQKSDETFAAFIGRLIGYHYPAESCGLMKKASRILKESFQNLPEREGQSVAENLLAYMAVIENRLKNEDGRAQCEAVQEVSRVVSIALCHHVHPREVRRLFLDAAKKINK